jgi:hypothetical protein
MDYFSLFKSVEKRGVVTFAPVSVKQKIASMRSAPVSRTACQDALEAIDKAIDDLQPSSPGSQVTCQSLTSDDE